MHIRLTRSRVMDTGPIGPTTARKDPLMSIEITPEELQTLAQDVAKVDRGSARTRFVAIARDAGFAGGRGGWVQSSVLGGRPVRGWSSLAARVAGDRVLAAGILKVAQKAAETPETPTPTETTPAPVSSASVAHKGPADMSDAIRHAARALANGYGAVITGGQGRSVTVEAIEPGELDALEAPALAERMSESLIGRVGEMERPIATGDVVTIHRGTRLYEVATIERDKARNRLNPAAEWEDVSMARVFPCDPEDESDPGWVFLDMLHRVPPVAEVHMKSVGMFEGHSAEVFRVTGQGWSGKFPVVRRVGVIYLNRKPLRAILMPVINSENLAAAGTLRIGDSLVIDGQIWRVVMRPGLIEPRLEPWSGNYKTKGMSA